MEENKPQEQQENIQETFEKQNVNKPETGSWKGVGIKRDEKGNVLPVHTSHAPNRRERRMEKRPISKRNRKNTAGRKTQTAPVMQVVDKTQYGDIKLPTGYQRKIHHTKVEGKVNRNQNMNKMKSYEARHPLPPAEQKQETEGDDDKG